MTDDPEMFAALTGWAMREVAPWWLDRMARVDAERRLHTLNAAQKSVSLFHFMDGRVSVLAKPEAVTRAAAHEARTALYLGFFQSVVPLLVPGLDVLIGVSVDDHIPQVARAPLFGFQRKRDGRGILLPDIEFLANDFYARRDADPYSYAEKQKRAVFSGATTGGWATAEVAASLATPRLRAAGYFRDSSRVDFRLPRIVQCTEKAAEVLLAAQSFCQRPVMSWTEQLAHRFLISMDGNGATCSRVAIALASNSVLLKYESENLLYYFGGLQPWVHYVPVRSDADVEKILDWAAMEPARFERIAAAGRVFAATYLTREAARFYMAEVIGLYAACVNGAAS